MCIHIEVSGLFLNSKLPWLLSDRVAMANFLCHHLPLYDVVSKGNAEDENQL
ncbi:hypothetical protein [Lysinibacillus sp. NPDC056232]|uniref:hypothetical protein n=1 Tax=Lysinibacillus sp. NPDC056232 TaxID=3345756 RepID=UPI0035DB8E9B